jgi:AAA ATPase domain
MMNRRGSHGGSCVARLGENGFMRPRGTSSRFVGRVAERALLGELVDEARAGTPLTVIICGEAGVGKSRLVAEVTAAARNQGTVTLTGSCSAVGRTSFAFAPFAEALRPLARELTPAGGDSIEGWVAPRLFRLVSGSVEAEQTRKPPRPDPLGASAHLGLFEEVLDTLEHAAVPCQPVCGAWCWPAWRF